MFMEHDLSTDRWYVFVHNANNDYEPEYPGINRFSSYEYPLGVRQHFSQALKIVQDIYEEINPREEVSYTIVER